MLQALARALRLDDAERANLLHLAQAADGSDTLARPRRRWGAHDVRHHGTGTKRFHHPVVGDPTLAYEGLEMAAEPGLTLTVHAAEPGSASEEGPRLLASWAATQESDGPARPLAAD
ncbi:hypothetical protein CLV63_10227 [Murinocardiopsis flavida]|uniref:MmyB-like transcription regulator ligand binding domain-containing protein n=1 Tax=Murinocardiopsis flavida TaxID=645275 RepID=A0A2P8DRR3_9ACTN|nr:hypothetical protein CLV63_10227 [Murinocardiopsis flavida]